MNDQRFRDLGGCWSAKKTATVGSVEASGFVLYDMIGNAWVWGQDCHQDKYKGAPADGSAWESGMCAARVLRGGSWYDFPRGARSADRGRSGPSGRNGNLGFRLARTLP